MTGRQSNNIRHTEAPGGEGATSVVITSSTRADGANIFRRRSADQNFSHPDGAFGLDSDM
ncbi:hypothetical protein C7I87_06155 [Mesorhizobium sp. SARCC-RB16n]|nr:hypothetical protein C7I87_06155 [Mesorhizobium sp. SARCC-RB16n]